MASGDQSGGVGFVRTEEAPLLPPPRNQSGLVGWLWRNLFQSMSNFSTPGAAAQSGAMILVTVSVAYFAYVQIAAFLGFAVFQAVWVADDDAKRLACATVAQGGQLPREWFGACYPFVSAKWKFLIYYNYPPAELWRVNVVFLLGALGVARLVAEAVPNRASVGAALVVAGVGYGLLVQELFGETFGVRVGVQMLIGIGLLYMLLRDRDLASDPQQKDGPRAPLFSRGRDQVIRLVLMALVIGVAVVSVAPAFSGDRSVLQEVALQTPMLLMTGALLVGSNRVVGAMMLTLFPLYALILLTGGHFETGGAALVVWALATLAFLAAGWFGRRGAFGEVGEALGGSAWTIGLISAALLGVAVVLGVDLGLDPVPTSSWGGLMVTLVVAVVGIVFSLPLGVLLALGRRSSLPAVRYLSIIFIEFWRGVPLITVLFMSSVMLPLFLPEDVDFNKLLRALIGVMLFAAAYQAEVVRGGLQAIPKGQFEGAQALGLGYWRMMALIVLPQALTLVIPGIVNTFIGLFKDTSLVLIISLFDLLGAVQAALTDSEWAVPVQASTGYLIAAAIFWIFCFGMSRYSLFMEQKLRKGRAR